MAIATIGIDLGKNSCSLAGLDETGAVVLRRRFSREKLVVFLAGQPACVVAMEDLGIPSGVTNTGPLV